MRFLIVAAAISRNQSLTTNDLHRHIQNLGKTVAGVPSFCAAAARLGTSLAEGDRPLHLVAATAISPEDLSAPATHVIMKAGGRMREVKELLEEAHVEVQAIERCGMDDEQIYPSLEAIPDHASYFTLVIARSQRTE